MSDLDLAWAWPELAFWLGPSLGLPQWAGWACEPGLGLAGWLAEPVVELVLDLGPDIVPQRPCDYTNVVRCLYNAPIK